ncbi:alanine--tRNA ligase [Natranaerobius thermophilus]|uniref:Alanine--tRNA ligase n=1 Tax=Natranaerobius thermophilus (strain ATCC BAA-1301 / DSM 18059 / JW/NM-WN-LF) TaxID=457570 RepID=SYA_NATTJ|nr:alanine--tRNA ligase [Natranaerobius thermophilus]B2A5J7.1 RecName: Full=Alanine--tRNA ligase; AltName: Full=Alanyl-tRNA synthetase; Short=AlaRS [Natranaerobius thermophilus JW/NM-WN-LF]ACB85352.1 alanyl-tRNA synthetase [Natranaerobius thermophilus JW/NM-WN-LF]
MRTHEIRKKFLEFFETKDHYVRKSYSIIPENDPSILLIGAGMAPLKPYFTGEKTPPSPRMATSQKCVRTPDIEEVGITARHATFFEMLGNFSFGDYFKREAIFWGYEFCTEWLSLSPEKLWASVYLDDDEAYDIWHDEVGIPHERIVRLGKEDNFWEIGTGPCGPCSEIHYDRGAEYGCDSPDCKPGCDCDRYLEIWNLVFTQFNRDEEGNYTTLKQKNIDTGAGLERLAVLLQDVPSIYEIDIIKPILDHVIQLSGVNYGEDNDKDISLRIITEHLRSVTFIVGDGVLPANEGRGYVLRRILRRASRHGKLLGIKDTFMSDGVDLVIDIMKEAYPELEERREYIKKIVEIEEDRFNKTVDQGLGILNEFLENMNKQGKNTLEGSDAFKLYDTYGFPLELTREIVQENGYTLDEQGFQEELNRQREQARKAQQESEGMLTESNAMKQFQDQKVEFTGYDNLEQESQIIGIIDHKNDDLLKEVQEGEEVQILINPTPFYGESGGQIGDTGEIFSDNGRAHVKNSSVNGYDQTVLQVKVTDGQLRTGDKVSGKVDYQRRKDIMKNHSATHMLHYALKKVVGAHVEQAGSLVAPDRLRFDFTHFAPLSEDEIKQIELEVNKLIRENSRVRVINTDLEEAKELGAVALFEDKYEQEVRVIEIGPAVELCGGTHATATGELGLFKIDNQTSVGAGVRRLEALTGQHALEYLDQKAEQIQDIAELLKTEENKVVEKTQEFLEDFKAKDKEIEKLKNQIFTFKVDDLLAQSKDISDFKLVANQLNDFDADSLRDLSERVKNKLDSGVVVLGSSTNNKALFVAMVTKDLVEKGVHAGNIVKEVAKITGGGGGGRPDMAQAGGKEPDKLNEAIMKVETLVRNQLSHS